MKILFVCMGNICRSPTAEGVFRRYLREHAPDLDVEIDSAGTHDYHVGEPPDPRTVKAAAKRGIDLSGLRARQVQDNDFDRFDLILVMDRLNHVTLLDRSPPEHHQRFDCSSSSPARRGQGDVPDPYYGSAQEFEDVLDLVEQASGGLVEELRRRRRQA